MLSVSVGALIAVVVLLHALLRRAVTLTVHLAPRPPATVTRSSLWLRTRLAQSVFAERHPVFARLLRDRFDPHQFSGVPLTLLAGAGIYVVLLFSGLAEDVLETEGVIRFDDLVNAAFAAWRVEPLITAFIWITTLGSSPAVVSAVIIATGFLWADRRTHMLAPLWIICAGAVATTSIGKFLIGRHRPNLTIEVSAPFSSFPSGHTAVAMAVYGFLAYAIARALPNVQDRFEVAYWTAVLIALIGLSRIVLGVHYLTDVAGGYLVGTFWLLLGFAIAEWTRSRRETPLGDSKKDAA